MSQIHIEQEHGSEVRVPKWALASMAGLMVVTMVFAGTARLTGMGTVGGPTEAVADARVWVDIRFEVVEDDGLLVWDYADGTVLRELAAGEGGFLRGVLRPLERERTRMGTATDLPYRLLRSRDGTLALLDPTTGVLVDLAAFGRTSLGAFSGLLETAGAE